MGHKLHKQIAAAAVIILVLLAWALRHYAPYSGRSSVKAAPAVVLAMEDVRLVGLGHDGKLWSAKAERVEIGQNRSIAKLSKISGGKIYDGSKVVLNAKAGEAVYDTYSKNLALSSGVEIQGEDGQKVAGNGLVWNSQTSSLRSMGGVSFQTKWGNASVGRLVADLKSKELKMWNISMRIRLSGADELQEAR
ncbi:MAG: LPS export ABC transporter periplasmic protein LptC [Armatimonadota bacterium]